MKKTGVSLMELVASMCIVALPSLAVTPVVSNLVQTARDTQSVQNMSTLEDHLLAFGDSLNQAESLLIHGETDPSLALPQDPLEPGFIPQTIREKLIIDALDVADGVADQRQALINAGIVQLVNRASTLDPNLEEKDQWAGNLTNVSEAGTLFAKLDLSRVDVQQTLEREFDQLGQVYDGTGTPVQDHNIIVVGIGADSQLVRDGLRLPLDPNALNDSYNRYYALYWVGTNDGTNDVAVPSGKAELLGVVDSQFRSKREVAQAILEAK
jgi:type II secretory pathway pseudopilin PulG